MRLKATTCTGCGERVNMEALTGFKDVVLCPVCSSTYARKEIEQHLHDKQQQAECRDVIVISLDTGVIRSALLMELIENQLDIVDDNAAVTCPLEVSQAEYDCMIDEEHMELDVSNIANGIITVVFTKGGCVQCQET